MSINLSSANQEEEQTKSSDKKTAETSPASEEKTFIDKMNNFLLRLSRVPLTEKLFFVRHLGVMMKAGISLSAALSTLAKQTKNKYFAKILNDVSSQVEKGTTLSESLKKHEKVFGELFINMIEAGEMSGKLEDVFDRLYIQMKKQHELISKVRGALTYPAVVITAMIGIGSFMMVFVVPKISDMFKDFSAELPLPTKILIGASDAIVNNGVLTAVSLILFIFAFIKILRTYKGKYYFQLLLLKLPILSPIIKKINLARFARTISSLLKTDIMIVKTFQITGSILGNLHYRAALLEMSGKIKKGSTIYEIISNYPHLFPPVVTQMISVGEETGELDNILEELAEFYENEVDEIMNNLPSIIEPVLILILGAGVGAMAVAIVMPMYSITQSM
ncbi:type II secretion system F family protein [Patescibacteria group bacterium]|nr:type II secretion system F family protein [Candidatus Falkowbacteria bacterium]MBU3905903.1 type II secretion system F family protein [Patescibacteria group bacterium]MBU4015433.1 type II secretion system F family protein [Patescibacteria group bacterium]MBU4026694.1 type II secretion system F family protein [Patescibacteria group bacterium]MBU4072967.1 type II secretion system F family protein [Patescibacteria group bacterium]